MSFSQVYFLFPNLFSKLKPKNSINDLPLNTEIKQKEIINLQSKIDQQDNYIKKIEQQFISLQSVVEKMQCTIDFLEKTSFEQQIDASNKTLVKKKVEEMVNETVKENKN